MDKKQIQNAIEYIDSIIEEHLYDYDLDIKSTKIPEYLLTARNVLIEKIKDIEIKEAKDIEDKEREKRILGDFSSIDEVNTLIAYKILKNTLFDIK